MNAVDAYLSACARRVEAYLDTALPAAAERPAILHEAMRYSVFAGGKRLRPALCFAACEACGGRAEDALRPAAALEVLHTYTLIHDDLPAMDDDALRRGRPTCHVAFGEANAILAGDALLTFAFELLAEAGPAAGRMAGELARAAGSRGVIAGQVEDIAHEGKPLDEATLRYIHRHKTGDLIRAAARLGVLASGNDGPLEALTRYAENVGLAFQIADDILNATADADALGKATGSDAARGKQTFVALMGVGRAGEEAEQLATDAVGHLAALPGPVEPLRDLAWYAVRRET